jgi:alginate export protein
MSVRRAVPCALVAACLLACVPDVQAQKAGAPPPIGSLRYDEDYSYLRDPRNRSGAWWEPLKFIPLDEAGHVYLTLGDEERVRYEYFRNNQFGSAAKRQEDYLRYRMLPYADLHLGPYARVFGQLQGAWSTRAEHLKNPFTDETGLDLVQGFADVSLPMPGEGLLTLRGGRQVLLYGAQRLISTGPNIRFSFDGGLVRWEIDDWLVDAFFVQPVVPDFGNFDDTADGSRRLWALYSTRRLPGISPAAGADLYYIGYENDRGVFNQGQGYELRHTLGARFFGARGSWSWDQEAMFQFGDFAGGDILAWAVAADTSYTFARLPLKPFLELRGNVISGDRDANDRSLETFNALFTNAEFFGEIGLLGPVNIMSVRPAVGVDLGSGWSLTGALTFFWRQRLDDGIYGPSLNVLRPAGDSRARYIGRQAEVALSWQANRHVSFRAVYSIFEPGRFIEDTGPAKTVRFTRLQAAFAF